MRVSLSATPQGHALPAGRSVEHRQALLHIVVVGGGPTGVEVAGEIIDFIDTDMRRLYPDMARDARVTLVEGRDILGSFDIKLREYAAQHLTKNGVKLQKVRHTGDPQSDTVIM